MLITSELYIFVIEWTKKMSPLKTIMFEIKLTPTEIK